MASLASINIRFRADLAQFSSEMQNVNRQMANVGKQFQSVGKSLSVALTVPLLALGVASVKTYGDIEALQKGLTAVMGSSEAAAVEFEKLKEVAKLPGLGLQEAVRGSVNLQAAGFSADEARKSLLSFGNALATVGKGAPELDLVVLALTQLNNKASGFGQDLRQLTEQLPQLRGALKTAFGTDDTAAISKMGVTGREVVQRLTAEFEKLPKVTGGINNAFENTSDAIKISLGKVGEALNKSLNIEGLMNSLSESLLSLADAFSELSPSAQTTIIVIAGVAASVGPLLVGFGLVLSIMPKVTLAIAAVRAAFTTLTATIVANPLGALAVVLGAIVATTIVATSRFTSLTNSQKEFANVMASASQSIAKESAEMAKNVSIARNDKLSKEQRLVAMQKINAASPELLGNLKLETINTKEATDALEKYNKALLQKAKVMAAEEKLVDIQKKILDLQLGQLNAVKPSVWQNLGNSFLSAGNSAIFASLQTQTLAKNLMLEGEELEKLQKLLIDFITVNGGVATAVNVVAGAVSNLTSGPLKGTIEWYENLIKAQRKIQTSLSTSNDSFADAQTKIEEYQKAIDKISGKRADISPIDVSKLSSSSKATVEFYEKQIAEMQKFQSQVATTSAQWEAFQRLILENELKIALIVDQGSFDGANTAIRGFGDNFKKVSDDFKKKQDEIKEKMEAVRSSVEGVFNSFGEKITDALGLASDGFQGFMKIILDTTIKLISMMLAQSLANAISGATASGLALGPGAVAATPAFIAAAIAGVLGAFAAIPKFETGGIVGGSSLYGDKILARLNSRELILNQDQQKSLYGMINPAVTAGDMMIQLMGGFEIDGSKLRLVLDRTDAKNNRIK